MIGNTFHETPRSLVGRSVLKGGMWALVVVQIQPLDQGIVEISNIRAVRQVDEKLLPDRPVEPFELGVVLRRPDAAPIVPELEFLGCLQKVMVELTAVVRLDILDHSAHALLQVAKERCRRFRVVAPVDAGVSPSVSARPAP